MKIKIEHEVSPEHISDILVTAFDGKYGGCWYWADPVSEANTWSITQRESGLGDFWNYVAVRDRMEDDSQTFVVDHSVIASGIEEILTYRVPIRSDLLAQVSTILSDEPDIDVDAADCIVQAGLFGELIYG